ncbi:MAG: amidohydrolase [Acidobacteria bacterium]|nr:amidohydrolase [Acidobacteriota bacterium]MCI0720736.1 amidohydrolase [Acidobacteriota bacterium]
MKLSTPKTELPPSTQLRNAVFGGSLKASFKVLDLKRMKRSAWFLLLFGVSRFPWSSSLAAAAPDLVVVGGRIVTGQADGTIREAMAVRDGRILKTGLTADISRLADSSTEVIDLKGAMVLPGLYEPHVHPQMVRLAYLQDPYKELRSIGEIQDWVRQRAREVPPGEWIRIPRNEITRLKERRHPTVQELDAACTTHPVVFDASRRYVFNSRGFAALGITADTRSLPPSPGEALPGDTILGLQTQNGLSRPVPGGEIILGANGKPQFLVTTSPQLTSRFASRRTWTEEEEEEALLTLHRAYHAAGITTIFERGAPIEDYRAYEKLKAAGRLSIRARFTMLQDFKSAKDVENFVRKENIRPGYGDDWLSMHTLKIVADGGMHFGNTYLSEPYGPKRAKAYVQSDPNFRGDLFPTEKQMADVFGAGARLGWQMAVHVTGDGGVDAVLRAMEAVNKDLPLKGKRFLLVHAYFPTPRAAARAAALGMCVDTHPNHYYLDAPFVHDVYGREWAERLIGLDTWIRAGVPVIISSDHMVGLDPDHSMNAYNPFRAMYAAVSRRTESGEVFGSTQKLSRLEALRAMTAVPAYVNFEEDKSGTLEKGKFADFVVIDRDYLKCPEKEILRIKPVRTVVAGKTVYLRQ